MTCRPSAPNVGAVENLHSKGAYSESPKVDARRRGQSAFPSIPTHSHSCTPCSKLEASCCRSKIVRQLKSHSTEAFVHVVHYIGVQSFKNTRAGPQAHRKLRPLKRALNLGTEKRTTLKEG